MRSDGLGPREVVRSGLCIGCGGCVAQAREPDAAMRWNAYGQLEPSGPTDWMEKGSPGFAKTCPFSPEAAHEDELAAAHFPDAASADGRIGRFEAAYVGHAVEAGFREGGSSGGMVSWVAAELLRRGMVDGVVHVGAADPRAEGRLFGYRISRSVEEVCAGAKSRYYPIELSAVIAAMRAQPGRYAVVGIPCFIKAVRLLCAQDSVLQNRVVFTLGLFCGHMKSTRMVDSFAWQMGLDPGRVHAVDYRVKDTSRPANWYTAELTMDDGSRQRQDWWHLVDGDWGAGFFQNAACNFCDDVVAETADIAFGDAWVEPYSFDGRGTNVVVVRSGDLNRLLANAIGEGRLDLHPVDADFVVETQAAGFRQRREGLSLRLAWRREGLLQPRKRVPAASGGVPLRRRLIYRARRANSAWSHRMFWLAHRLGMPALYLAWGRAALTLYHALAYSRGRAGRLVDRVMPDERR